MIKERWQQVLYDHGNAVALWHSHGAMTFAQIDAAARKLETSSDHVLAQGGALEILIALVAGFITNTPVAVVEKDRQRRVPKIDPPRETCLIKQTVGGTGVRRCQFFTAPQIIADVDRLHRALELNKRGVCVAAISPAHSYGLTVTVLQTIFNGVPMHWLPEPFPAGLSQAIAEHEQVFLPGIPALWRAWLMAGVDFGRVSLAVSAGSPLTLELEHRVMETQGRKLHNLYGTSECGAVTYDASDTLRSEDSFVGELLPGVSASLVGDALLKVQSDAVGLGYDEPFPDETFGQGEFTTRDQFTLSGSELHFHQCQGKGINVAGRKLSPSEIAEKLTLATGVTCGVHGAPSRDAERCEEVVAEVALPHEALTQEFRRRACDGLAPWEIPRRWIAVD